MIRLETLCWWTDSCSFFWKKMNEKHYFTCTFKSLQCQSSKKLKDDIPWLLSRLWQSVVQQTFQISVSTYCIFQSAAHPSSSSHCPFQFFALPVNNRISDDVLTAHSHKWIYYSIKDSCQRIQINKMLSTQQSYITLTPLYKLYNSVCTNMLYHKTVNTNQVTSINT